MLPGVNSSSSSLQDVEDYTQQEMDRIGALIEGTNDTENNLICMVYGSDGTSKSGLVMSYLINNDKKTLYLDIDGNSKGLLTNVYNNNKLIRLINPRKSNLIYDKKYDLTVPEIDYRATMAEIKLLAYWLAENSEKFDAVVIDGISTLLYYAEQQMRLDKNIDPDGTVSMKYWLNRNKTFLDTLDLFRDIPNIDIFYVGHDNFTQIPGTKSINMGGEMVKIGNTSSVVEKTNRMVDQRIYLELQTKDGKFDPTKDQNYKVIATIHKWRDNAEKVFKKYLILEREDGKISWHDENIETIFAPLTNNRIKDGDKVLSHEEGIKTKNPL